jgi:uncharacterized protein with HEPN domain
MSNKLKELLELELKQLREAGEILEYSLDVCSKIGIKEDYTFEELDKFEALTGRFARTSDILIQKIFRTLDNMELELPGTAIDRINRAERRGLISADTFKEIRYLRNDIAHEYVLDMVDEIYKKTLELAPYLLETMDKVLRLYSKKKD